LKHFAVNNQETRRFTVNAVVDERTLHEIYLTGFEIAVRKAQPWTIMCAYNAVNGEFCAQNPTLLTDVLRDQWGYDGFVMSDWGAVHDRVASLQAGLELEMPGPSPHRTQAVVEAVEAGDLDETILNRAVERLLNIIFRAQETPKGGNPIDIDSHHVLARRIAAECIVLLKNDYQLLPLNGDENLAVIGRSAQTFSYQGGGSSHINSTRVDSPLEFLKERAEVQYVIGDGTLEGVDHGQIEEAVTVARAADVAVLFMALPASIESEGYDRPHLKLTDQQIALIKAVAAVNPRTIVVLNNGSALDMSDWLGDVGAVLEAWLPGQAGAGAITDVLYGTVNPSGKLGETFPLKLTDTPAYFNFPGEHNEVRYGEGIFVGYRAYDALERDVLFPFGFGLSYTHFAYSNLQVSAKAFTISDQLEVRLDVTNTGERGGQEVVQLYVHDVHSKLPRPPKELKAFTKIALEAGETKRVSFTLDTRAFSYYHPAYGQWLAEAGDFEILIGSSAGDIHLREQVSLSEGTPLPVIIDLNSTLGDWLEDAQGAELTRPLLDSMFGAEEADALGVDAQNFFRDLPLTVLLSFKGTDLERDPQEIVAGMIEELKSDKLAL
jgi:beta-glucosidase